jgi:hypothetical protein
LIILTPRVLTIKTLWLVNTEYLTAFRAAPPFFFVSNEMPYAEFSNVLEIADHAHAILGSISLIQMVQPDAREAVTTETVLDFRVNYLLTVLYSTYDTGFRFEIVVTSASGAWFPISCICDAEAAIHSAGSD